MYMLLLDILFIQKKIPSILVTRRLRNLQSLHENLGFMEIKTIILISYKNLKILKFQYRLLK